MTKEQTLPTIKCRSRDLKKVTDALNGAAVTEIHLQDLENKTQGILTVGNEGVEKQGVGVLAAAANAKYADFQCDWLPITEINHVPLVAAMWFVQSSGSAGGAVLTIQLRVIGQRIE